MLRPLILLLPVLLISVSAATQSSPPAITDIAPPLDPRLEPTPLSLQSKGLSFHPPRGALVNVQKADNNVTLLMADYEENPRWTVRFEDLHSSLPQPTAAGQIADHLTSLAQQAPDGQKPFTLLRNEPIEISGRRGHICYIERTALSGYDYIAGWLIVPVSGQVSGPKFLAASIITLRDHLAYVEPLLDASFKTLKLRDEQQFAQEVQSDLASAAALLKTFDEPNLEQLLGYEQWTRIYLPNDPNNTAAPGEDRELGWTVTRVQDAQRGILNHERDPERYSPAEEEYGFVVTVNAQFIDDAARGYLTDVARTYWLAWDGREEQWSVVVTRRQGQAESSNTLTGLRTYNNLTGRSKLTVITSDSSGQRDVYEWPVPSVYLPQALSPILGKLLPHDATTEQVYSWYFVNMTTPLPSLSRRIDTWNPVPGDPTIGFELRTQLGRELPEAISTFTPGGRLIQTTRVDGARNVAIEADALRDLWKQKGLPTSGQPARRPAAR